VLLQRLLPGNEARPTDLEIVATRPGLGAQFGFEVEALLELKGQRELLRVTTKGNFLAEFAHSTVEKGLAPAQQPAREAQAAAIAVANQQDAVALPAGHGRTARHFAQQFQHSEVDS